MASAYRLEILHSFAELHVIAEQWDQLLLETRSDVYFTLEWMEVWWEHYSGNSEFLCFVLWNGDKIVAGLPFSLESSLVGLLPFKMARLVSSHSTIIVMNPPVSQPCSEEFLNDVLRHLFQEQGCHFVSLSPLSGVAGLVESATKTKNCHEKISHIYFEKIGLYTLFELADNLDQYLQNMKRSRRQKLRYEQKQIDKDLNAQFLKISNENVVNYFERFVKWHTVTWNAVGRGGHFSDWPGSFEFHKDLITRLYKKGRVKFFEMRSDEEILSIGFSYELPHISHNRLTARNINKRHEKYGVGRAGYLRALGELMSEGKGLEESGPGHYQYKVSIGGQEIPLYRVIFIKPNFYSRLVQFCFAKYADVLHFFYYRLWYLKVVPKFKLKSKPLWRRWIRSRF